MLFTPDGEARVCYGVRERDGRKPIKVGDTVERDDLPGDLLAPLARIVAGLYAEVRVQQVDHRQVRAGLAVRDRERLQHHPARLRNRLEFVEQTRLADPRLGHRRDYLTMTSHSLVRSGCHRIHLALATN